MNSTRQELFRRTHTATAFQTAVVLFPFPSVLDKIAAAGQLSSPAQDNASAIRGADASVLESNKNVAIQGAEASAVGGIVAVQGTKVSAVDGNTAMQGV